MQKHENCDVTPEYLTNWCDEYISDKWLPSIMLKNGIGMHHGELPTFIRKYILGDENMKKY